MLLYFQNLSLFWSTKCLVIFFLGIFKVKIKLSETLFTLFSVEAAIQSSNGVAAQEVVLEAAILSNNMAVREQLLLAQERVANIKLNYYFMTFLN